MKHLNPDKLYIELDTIRKQELTNICGYALEYCKEHDLRSPMKTINEYARMFKGDYNSISIKEELNRK